MFLRKRALSQSSTPRRDFQTGAELLEHVLCVNTRRDKLCVLAKHLAEDLLAAPVNEHDTAQVDQLPRDSRGFFSRDEFQIASSSSANAAARRPLDDPAFLGTGLFN